MLYVTQNSWLQETCFSQARVGSQNSEGRIKSLPKQKGIVAKDNGQMISENAAYTINIWKKLS